MLTEDQVHFYQTFGYVVVDIDVLSDITTQLHRESEHAIKMAYPDNPVGNLILPAMSDETPYSLALIHDKRFLDAVAKLAGPGAIIKPPKITRFSKPTNWHRDCYMNLRGVKFAVYFGEPDSEPIPFDVLPASHDGSVRSYIDLLFSKQAPSSGGARDPNRHLPKQIPTNTLQLAPGQFLIFDLGLWHANLVPTSRLQWGITFLTAPEDNQSVVDTATHLAEFLEYKREYPKNIFPYLPPSWESGESDSVHARVLKDSGVLDQWIALSRASQGV